MVYDRLYRLCDLEVRCVAGRLMLEQCECVRACACLEWNGMLRLFVMVSVVVVVVMVVRLLCLYVLCCAVVGSFLLYLCA